jgi:hypothetical protein
MTPETKRLTLRCFSFLSFNNNVRLKTVLDVFYYTLNDDNPKGVPHMFEHCPLRTVKLRGWDSRGQGKVRVESGLGHGKLQVWLAKRI